MPNYKQPRKSLSVTERDRRKLAALENARRLLRYESTNNPPPSNLPPPSDRLGNEDDFLAGVDPLISDFGAGVDPDHDDWRTADDESSFDSQEDTYIPPEEDSDEDDGE